VSVRYQEGIDRWNIVPKFKTMEEMSKEDIIEWAIKEWTTIEPQCPHGWKLLSWGKPQPLVEKIQLLREKGWTGRNIHSWSKTDWETAGFRDADEILKSISATKDFIDFHKQCETKTTLHPCTKTHPLGKEFLLASKFWAECKEEEKCALAPYDLLLDNRELREDYEGDRITRFLKRCENKHPLSETELKDSFWIECKARKKCSKMPFKRLVIEPANPELRTDYLITTFLERCGKYPLTADELSDPFWIECKQELKCREEPYTQLVENAGLWEDYEISRFLKQCGNKYPLSADDLSDPLWEDCKEAQRCSEAPFDRLLANRGLRQDYEITVGHAEKEECHQSAAANSNPYATLSGVENGRGDSRTGGSRRLASRRRLVDMAYYIFIAFNVFLMCILAAAIYVIYRQRDWKPPHLAWIDAERRRARQQQFQPPYLRLTRQTAQQNP